jgi:TonB family protein
VPVKEPSPKAEPAQAPPQGAFPNAPPGSGFDVAIPPHENDVIPFGNGMTPPEKISGPSPVYTKEALAQRVEGPMILKCVITREGQVKNCRIIRPLPHMESAVLDALYQSRYKPVTYQGVPVNADYTFNLQLTLPKPQKAP